VGVGVGVVERKRVGMLGVLGMLGPCGDCGMRVTAIVHVGGIVGKGETGGGGMDGMGGGGESGSGGDGRVVGLIGAIAIAEIVAHLMEGESALGDIGRAETTASVALDEALGEKKVGHAFSPNLDVLLGLQERLELG
jgi:hypothetical protein